MNKWLTADYLANGNTKQRLCFDVLRELKLLEALHNFEPLIVGTIPIEIDIDSSDLDIICNAQNLEEFQLLIASLFSELEGFEDDLHTTHYVAHFFHQGLEIEIFADSKPSIQQNAYRHMLIENRILELSNSDFREQIIDLKKKGYKTEPAFGKLLNMKDAYTELLSLEDLSNTELKALIEQHAKPSNSI